MRCRGAPRAARRWRGARRIERAPCRVARGLLLPLRQAPLMMRSLGALATVGRGGVAVGVARCPGQFQAVGQ